jgi:hypothetical protein
MLYTLKKYHFSDYLTETGKKCFPISANKELLTRPQVLMAGQIEILFCTMMVLGTKSELMHRMLLTRKFIV